jgi:glycerol-3-phosphate acyltransferase PlsY
MTINIVLKILLASLVGYLLGASNMAYYLARIKKVDIRQHGSGNLGASNATIVLGKKFGILTFFHDVGKTVLAIFLMKWFFPNDEYLTIFAGASSVLGHIYPFYLKFKGGKGLASFMGVLLALDWQIFLIMLFGAVLITIISNYIVFGTVTVTTVSPIVLFFTNGWIFAVVLAVASFAIIWKHRENFVKLKNGKEIGFRRAMSGKDKKT